MLKARLSETKKILEKNKIDAALISSIPSIIYLTDFSHFSEIEREAFVLITPKNNYIFTDARYSHAVKSKLKSFKLAEISIKNTFTKLLKEIVKKEKIKVLGVEENNINLAEHKKILSVMKSTKHFNLRKLRMIKKDDEVEKIKKSCEIGDKAFLYILKKIKLGMTEKEIAFELEHFIRKNHAEPSFPTIVAIEENAAIPHHKTSNQKLKTNNLILLDFGIKYKNYCSDMTRTIFFGKASPEKKKAYEVVLDAQQKIIDYFSHTLFAISHKQKTSTIKLSASSVDTIARKYIVDAGYPSIPHSLGHGIGLQVHEAPSLSPKSQDVLTNGMVFSIEPGIYLPDEFGIRIEDLFAIENGKLVQLTISPRELIEL